MEAIHNVVLMCASGLMVGEGRGGDAGATRGTTNVGRCPRRLLLRLLLHLILLLLLLEWRWLKLRLRLRRWLKWLRLLLLLLHRLIWRQLRLRLLLHRLIWRQLRLRLLLQWLMWRQLRLRLLLQWLIWRQLRRRLLLQWLMLGQLRLLLLLQWLNWRRLGLLLLLLLLLLTQLLLGPGARSRQVVRILALAEELVDETPPPSDQDRDYADAGARGEAVLDPGVDDRLERLIFAPHPRRCRCRRGWVARRGLLLLLLRCWLDGFLALRALLPLRSGRTGNRDRGLLPTAAQELVVGLDILLAGATAAGGVARREHLPLVAFGHIAFRGAAQPPPRVSRRRVLQRRRRGNPGRAHEQGQRVSEHKARQKAAF